MTLTYQIADADFQRIVTAIVALQAPPSGLGGLTPPQFTKKWIIQQALQVTKQYERQQATQSALATVVPPTDIVTT